MEMSRNFYYDIYSFKLKTENYIHKIYLSYGY